jgi:type I restriction enzyme M protein
VEKDYNLSVSSYVEIKEDKEEIDIDELNKSIKETIKKVDYLRKEIDKVIEEIS